MTEYYYAKEREESAVERINDSYLEALNSLEKLEVENHKLRELVRDLWKACPADGYYCIYHCEHYDRESESHCKLEDRMSELGIEVNDGTE